VLLEPADYAIGQSKGKAAVGFIARIGLRKMASSFELNIFLFLTETHIKMINEYEMGWVKMF
jgi:hypothetical protein